MLVPRCTAIIGSSAGLHARPASVIAQAVAATGLRVTMALEGGQPVDARSVLEIMALGVKKGDVVTIAANCGCSEADLRILVDLLERDLDACRATD